MKFKEILEGIKLNARLVKSILKDRKNVGKTFTYDMINEEGFIFDYAPATLAKFKVMVAGMQVVQFSLFSYKPLFIYDDLYLYLTEETQEFIKHHELGHFNLHKSKLLYGGERNIDDEYEADSYAASMVGLDKAIEGLEELKDLLNTVTFKSDAYAVKEIEARILKLKIMETESKMMGVN